ncbi:hypothetical protein AB9J70_08255 [Elizabethkingia anophelis]|jgi:acetyltransferase-like isoleucine patch superfamily enzyme|uniref:acyltransferase n=1 Tax=Elizabethkingia anophelis TaxID=1117645 RepID=UPI003556FFD7
MISNTNNIHETAKIHPNVTIGEFNNIGANVKIEILGNNPNARVCIGDNNIINDNTRIFVHGELCIGDWNVFHNDMLIMAEDHIHIGHNGWFGQNTILDGAGGLIIGNGVRVGMYSQIWTHVASGEQLEGCILYAKRGTEIKDDVWLVGSCYVGSGIRLEKRSTVLINSVVTKDTIEGGAYSGSPAKLMEKVKFYVPKTIEQKFDMLINWLGEFVNNNSQYKLELSAEQITIINLINNDITIFAKSSNDNKPGVFYLEDKTFNKTNSLSEREIYKFLYNNKARFIPNK